MTPPPSVLSTPLMAMSIVSMASRGATLDSSDFRVPRIASIRCTVCAGLLDSAI